MGKPRSTVGLVCSDNAIGTALGAFCKTAKLHFRQFGSAQEFLAGSNGREFGCIVLDEELSGMSGLELLEIFGKRLLPVPVIYLVEGGDITHAVQALKSGAFEVLEKPLTRDRALEVLAAAVATSRRWKVVDQDRKAIRNHLERLTPRELQVLDLMVGGRTNIAIAKHLGISRKTLDIHRSKVVEKMEARSLADLVRFRLIEKYPPSLGTVIKQFDYR